MANDLDRIVFSRFVAPAHGVVDATWVERAIWRCTEVVPGSLMRISRARRRARQSESYPDKARTGDGSGLVLCVPKQSPQNTVHL